MKVEDNFRVQLNELNKTFNTFLQRRIQRELLILKPEIQKVKEVIKEKLGVALDSRS